MADAGEIKAKVTIEYDGSGLEKAKEDLASLAEAAGTVGDSMGKAGTSVSEVGDQLAQSAIGAGDFSEGLKAIEAPMNSAMEALPQFSEALGAGQVAVQEVGKAFEELGPPLESSVSLLEAAPAPMAAISQHAQSMSDHLGSASNGFVQIQESLAQSVPLLPQYADSMKVVDSTLVGSSQGFSDFYENMAVFQDALQNPAPFEVVQSHLNETGQAWSDFTSSVGEDNMHLLHSMNEIATNTGAGLGPVALTPERLAAIGPEVVWDQTASSITGASTAASDAVSPFAALNETVASTGKGAGTAEPQMNAMNEAVVSSGKAAKDATPQIGAMNAAFDDTGSAVEGVGKSIVNFDKASMGAGGMEGFLSGVSDFGGAVGDAVGGVMGALNTMMMPLMAVQMIGMAVGTVASGMYQAATIAEGPAAHGVGTFTGAIDEMAQSSAKAGQTFSESFGQNIMPVLNALNNSSGGTNTFAANMGGYTGTLTSLLVGGLLTGAGALFDPLGFTGLTQLGTNITSNTAAQAENKPQPYTGVGPYSPAQQYINEQLPQIPAQVAMNAAQSTTQGYMTIANAESPAYLQSQDYTAAAARYYQQQQTAYNGSHYISPLQAKMSYDTAQYNLAQQANEANQPSYEQIFASDPTMQNFDNMLGLPSSAKTTNGNNSVMGSLFGTGGGINFGGIGNWFSNLFTGDGGTGAFMEAINKPLMNAVGGFGQLWNDTSNYMFPSNSGSGTGGGGCFPAGTRVLMTNGGEKPIETLQVGDQVIGHDDTRQVPTVVLARIVPPPKQTYELIFSDGNTLTLTDSHPIATTHGWKSLSPSATKKENPSLIVTVLQVGDSIYTVDGTCLLTSIQTREIVQVYNITVGDPHTFYANGVLVHNKASSMTTGSQPLGSQIADQVQSIQLPQMDLSKLGSSLAGNFGNIEIPQIHANVSWSVSGELNKVWQTVSSWSLSGELEKAWQAASSWSLSGELEKIWQSMSSWSLSGELNKVWQTVSSWNLMGDLEKAWNAVSSWNLTGDLEKMWHGIATWTAEGLEHTFNAVANWVASNLNPVFNVAATFIGLPGFATGVENFSGGAAIVGENGPELVTLPSGSSVYPMTVGPGVGSTATLGGGSSGSGGGTPQSVNISVNLDSQTFIQALGIPLANSIRVGMGQRGY